MAPLSLSVSSTSVTSPSEKLVGDDLIASLICFPSPPPPPPTELPLPPPPPRRFADKVERLRENGDEWKVAGKGNKKKNRLSKEQTRTEGSRAFHQGHVTGTGNLVSPDLTPPVRPRTPLLDICIKPTSKLNRSGSLIPNSKGQRRPKSGSPSNIEDGQKNLLFGLSTLESVTGISSDQKRERMETRNRRIRPSDRSPLIVSSCLFIIFAASITSITIASHNLHSFQKSAAYHKACIQNNNGVWFSQEHWLSESQLPTLKQLGTQFVARSGMEDAISKRLLVFASLGPPSWIHSSLLSPIFVIKELLPLSSTAAQKHFF